MLHVHPPIMTRPTTSLILFGVCALASMAQAQSDPAPASLDPVVVTATRNAARSFDVPASIDVIDGATIRAQTAGGVAARAIGR